MKRRVITFYSTGGAYGCFSNFAAYPITIGGREWPTSEHYFQGQKFASTPDEEEIRLEPSPMKAARMGRSRRRPLRSDWNDVKDDVMRKAVSEKFRQHDGLRVILLATGGSVLVEHTRNDSYWGDGGDGSGKNRLGEILMEVRAQLWQGN